MTGNTKIKIKILEKEYDIACPLDERTELLDSAEMLNEQMRGIRDSGKVIGLDRIAVMSALNLAHEVVKMRNMQGTLDQDKDAELTQCLRSARNRIQDALGEEPGNDSLDF